MNWKVTLSDIDLDSEEIKAVNRVLKSKWLSMGPVTQEFEENFKKFCGVKHAFAVSNCTAALHLACLAIGLKPDDEVIVPSLTFVATVNAVLYTGAAPVFADAESIDNFNISPESIEDRITSKTKAVVVMHYGGYPCRMDKIIKLAQKYNLYVIEDAAHAPGAEFEGRKLGTIGDIGCFSFFSNKNIATGEGGMIVTNNGAFAEKIKVLRSHGMTTLTWQRYKGHAHTYDVVDLGYNYRIDELSSAMGVVQLKKLTKNNQRRKNIVRKYVNLLSGIPDIRIPFKNHSGKSSYHLFPIILSKDFSRKKFITWMGKNGIQASIHYPPVHLFSHYKKTVGCKKSLLPVTEEIGNRVVTLPLHPLLKSKDIVYVCQKIKEVFCEEKR